jgi:hypothetical protein
MKRSAMTLAAAFLTGCATTQQPNAPLPKPITSLSSLSGLQQEAARLPADATVQAYVELLGRVDDAAVASGDRNKAISIEKGLLERMRKRVGQELAVHHSRALSASDYSSALAEFKAATTVLALYPMSDEKAVLEEATSLSRRHEDVRFRIELIRRQRYNYWAATELQKALQELREGGKGARDKAVNRIRTIEPTLLEESASSLYRYAVQQIMDDTKKPEDKAEIVKQLTLPGDTRRTLEGF